MMILGCSMFIVLVNIQMNEYTNNNKDTDILSNIQKHQQASDNHQYTFWLRKYIYLCGQSHSKSLLVSLNFFFSFASAFLLISPLICLFSW